MDLEWFLSSLLKDHFPNKCVHDFDMACCWFATPLTRMDATSVFTTLITQNMNNTGVLDR